MGDVDFELLFQDAERLKQSCLLGGVEDVRSGSTKWQTRQELQDLYRKMLLSNLELSIKRGVDIDLWKHAFYNFISIMNQNVKDPKTTLPSIYKLFLNASTGFFSQLLQDICVTYQKSIPAISSTKHLGIVEECLQGMSMVEKNFKYICHFCLVKLGDLARYHHDSGCAQAFYYHALEVKPRNGQPYNQLAILSVSEKQHVVTLYLHVRSVAVQYPFPAGYQNLNHWLLRAGQESRGASVLDQKKFQNALVNLSASILLRSDSLLAKTLGPDTALVQTLAAELLAEFRCLLQSEVVKWRKLVQIVCIIIFLYNYTQVNSELVVCQKTMYRLLIDLMSVLVCDAEERQSGPLLPALIILSHWLQKYIVLDEEEGISQGFWVDVKSLITKLSKESEQGPVHVALPEEREVRSFQPLQEQLQNLNFSSQAPVTSHDSSRLHRLSTLLSWATQSGRALMRYPENQEDQLQVVPQHLNIRLEEKRVMAPHFGPPAQLPMSPMSPMFAAVPVRMLPGPYPISPDRPPFMPRFPSLLYPDHMMPMQPQMQNQMQPQNQLQMQPDMSHDKEFNPQAQNFLPSNNTSNQMMANQMQSSQHMMNNNHMTASSMPSHLMLPPPIRSNPQGMYMPGTGGEPNYTNGVRENQQQNMQMQQQQYNKEEESFNNYSPFSPSPHLFVSSTSPFSLGTTPWAPTVSDTITTRGALQDIWSLNTTEELTPLQQLLNSTPTNPEQHPP